MNAYDTQVSAVMDDVDHVARVLELIAMHAPSDLRVMSTVRPILVNPGGIANYIFGKHLGTKH